MMIVFAKENIFTEAPKNAKTSAKSGKTGNMLL
jgi:hypothetical protein